MAQQKVQIKITSRFTDENNSQLFGPGTWDVDPATAERLVASGKATRIGGASAAAKAPTKTPEPPEGNPRIPEKKEPEAEVTETELPEDFPSRDILVAAGFDTVEKLKAENVKDELVKVDGLGPATITKIGLAISKI